MELKPGYKQTEVGVIPEDWDVQPLLKAVHIANGQVNPKHEPYKSMILVAPDHIESSTGKLLSKKTAADQGAISGKYMFESGDILYSKIRPYLRKAILADFSGLCSADMYPLKPAPWASGSYILAVILGHRFTRYAESVSVRSGMPKINRAEMADFAIAVPPLLEQIAIGSVLSEVDRLIGELESLIAKKRNIKQAAMQELLTGKRRLPGFEGEWEVKRLGELCSMKSGEGITAKSIDAVSLFPCYGGNGQRGFTSRFTHEGDYCLIGRVGALCGNLLKVSGQFFASEHAIVVSAFETVDVAWLTLALGTLNLNRRAESSAQPVLTVSKLLPLELRVPPTKQEQIAIAAVLSDMDAELASLEARLDKSRDFKQGMMQQLLTGKIRLT